MYYDEFLKLEEKIIEITKEEKCDEALKKYFNIFSRKGQLVSSGLEDLLIKENIKYEKICVK